MSHATSAFTVAAFIVAWLHVRERWTVGGFVLLGALAGLMTSVREQDAFFAAGPAIDLLVQVWRGEPGPGIRAGRPSLRLNLGRLALGLAAGTAAFALVYVPQAIAYMRLNGRPGPSELVSRKMSWHSPHALQVLASPEHGLLFWTPLAALAIIGLVAIARKRALIGVCLLAMVAAQIYVSGVVESWTVAGAFGQRRFVSAHRRS